MTKQPNTRTIRDSEYDRLRDEADQLRGRAEVAEDELVLAIGHQKQLRAALEHIKDLAGQPAIMAREPILAIATEALDGAS